MSKSRIENENTTVLPTAENGSSTSSVNATVSRPDQRDQLQSHTLNEEVHDHSSAEITVSPINNNLREIQVAHLFEENLEVEHVDHHAIKLVVSPSIEMSFDRVRKEYPDEDELKERKKTRDLQATQGEKTIIHGTVEDNETLSAELIGNEDSRRDSTAAILGAIGSAARALAASTGRSLKIAADDTDEEDPFLEQERATPDPTLEKQIIKPNESEQGSNKDEVQPVVAPRRSPKR